MTDTSVMVKIFLSQGGIWLVVLMDTYVAAWGPLLVGFFMCIALGWVYGVDYFCANIRAMLGREPTSWWRNMWRMSTPITLLVIYPSSNNNLVTNWST